MTLFDRLRHDAGPDWHDYAEHEFVHGLSRGTLAPAAFRYYLEQDYLFLIQFARAYALAAFKADTVEDMRAAAETMRLILEVEMKMHAKYCAGWGLTEQAMAARPEDEANMAYTRYVLERGLAGDALDLHVALAPCVVGYGVIGTALERDPDTLRAGNPYAEWIAMYAGAEYQAIARAATEQLDRLWARRGNEARYQALRETFRAACRLETSFWQMGLDHATTPGRDETSHGSVVFSRSLA
jgi:thiaminase/transcriptional activator TenA